MELLFVVLIGVLAGLLARGVLPHRQVTGVLLLPAIGGVSAAIVWVALTWAGLKWDGGWIWVATIAACLLTLLAANAWVTRARRREDENLFDRVSRSGAPAARVAGASRSSKA